ncbi:MAG: hypothetical protein AB7I01_15740 [Gammaproteobacteria bacterium]
MYSFETLLHASTEELLAIFSATRVQQGQDDDLKREAVAQQLGLRVPQLLCALGFNHALPAAESVCRTLGFGGVEGLLAARNYAFIHDVYRALSINNIVEIYAAIGRLQEPGTDWSELVMTRIANLEGQLEETINPILIGGYKLEIRAIYDNRLASPAFVRARLTPNHAVMRDIANENSLMLERGAIEPLAFLECAGLTYDEKRRAVFLGLIPPPVADHYIRQIDSTEERLRFREALTSSGS